MGAWAGRHNPVLRGHGRGSGGSRGRIARESVLRPGRGVPLTRGGGQSQEGGDQLKEAPLRVCHPQELVQEGGWVGGGEAGAGPHGGVCLHSHAARGLPPPAPLGRSGAVPSTPARVGGGFLPHWGGGGTALGGLWPPIMPAALMRATRGGLRASRGPGGPSIGATVSSGRGGGALRQGGPLPGGKRDFPPHQRGHLPGTRSGLRGHGGPGPFPAQFPGAMGAARGATGAVARPHGGRTLSSSSSPPGRGGRGGSPQCGHWGAALLLASLGAAPATHPTHLTGPPRTRLGGGLLGRHPLQRKNGKARVKQGQAQYTTYLLALTCT